MPTFDRYEELQAYLRGFVQFGGDDPPYDFNGIVHLMLALLDNLRSNALEADLEDVRGSFTDDQAAFFLKLAEYVRRAESTEPTMSERHDEIRNHIVAILGNIDASQVAFKRDPATGNEYVRVELRDDKLEWALRENGHYVRQAAMDLGIDIEV